MSESEPNYTTVDMHMPDGRVVPITGTYHDYDAAKDAAVTKEYEKAMAAIERDYQTLLDAGVTKEELAGVHIKEIPQLVAQQLQGEAGNGPVGDKLVRRLRSAQQGMSVSNVAMLSGLSYTATRNRLDGNTPVTVDEAAQLAVAYGVTTGELLGIVDADEVKLLKLFRSGSEEQRKALLAVLGPWGEKDAWQCG